VKCGRLHSLQAASSAASELVFSLLNTFTERQECALKDYVYRSFSYVTIQFSINVVFLYYEVHLSGGKNRQHCEQNRQFINEMLERKTGGKSSRLGSGRGSTIQHKTMENLKPPSYTLKLSM
jgi:hypothetical protein